jgi:general secretion pathway protein I
MGPALRQRLGGFTLVEVLVALMIVAIGLSALLVAVSGTARTSGYLRDKTLAQWIALNRLTEVRLNSYNKFAQNTDTAEVQFAGRTWHYDTRYFDTSISTMKRVVVRVYSGDAKTKGNPLAESTSFLGTALGAPGGSNTDWTAGSTVQSVTNPAGTPAVNSPGNTHGAAPVVLPGSGGLQPTSPVNPAPNSQ